MPSAVAVKISAELAESARAEAEHSDRSLTGQIEHWAKLGRVAETLLPTQVATALKRSGGNLDELEEDMKRRVLAAIATVHGQRHYQQAEADLMKAGGPRYEADLADPKGVVQVQPDGSRTRGHIVGRKFIPSGQ